MVNIGNIPNAAAAGREASYELSDQAAVEVSGGSGRFQQYLDAQTALDRPAAPTPARTERQLLSALISNAPMKISGADELPDGGGTRADPETGEIFVLKGMGFYDTFRSVAHELCYAEAVRDSGESAVDPQFTAYCASYVVCKKYGVNTREYRFDYAPAQFVDLDARAVKRELTLIQNAADAVSGRMEKQLETAVKSVKTQEARVRDETR